MTNYQLAKLMHLAGGGLSSRKRIQKTVHLLQTAGCRFDLPYKLHYYGPYCSDLAEKLDRLTGQGMLVESTEETRQGTQYSYELNQDRLAGLQSYESTDEGAEAKAEMERFAPLLRELIEVSPWKLELASTIAYFRQSGLDWDGAVQKAATFKNESVDSDNILHARTLAERVFAYSG